MQKLETGVDDLGETIAKWELWILISVFVVMVRVLGRWTFLMGMGVCQPSCFGS